MTYIHRYDPKNSGFAPRPNPRLIRQIDRAISMSPYSHSGEIELMRQPDYRLDLWRSYGPGKFNNYADAYLYDLINESSAYDDIIEGYTSYTLAKGPFEHPQLKRYKGGAIMVENDQGFVVVEWFISPKKLANEWDRIVSEIEADQTDEDDND